MNSLLYRFWLALSEGLVEVVVGKSVSGKLYKEALSEVLQECVRRTGLECPKNLIKWALNGFTGFTKIMLASRPGEAIPSSILVHLDSIAEDMQESDQSMKKAESKVRRDVIQVDSTRRRCPYPSSSSSSDMIGTRHFMANLRG